MHPMHTLLVVSLEESEYLVAEDDLLSVTITMNDEPSHDFMVEVTITDETARGTYILMYVSSHVQKLRMYIRAYIYALTQSK